MEKITLTKDTVHILAGLEPEDLMELMVAIPLAMEGTEVKLKGLGAVVWPLIQNNINHYKSVSEKRKAAGAQGGRGNKAGKSKVKQTKQTQAKKANALMPAPGLVFAFESEKFKEAWGLWVSYRSEIKKGIKGLKAAQGQMNKLARLSRSNEETARAIIIQSIENNWTGLFELKTENNEQQNAISKEAEQFSNRSAVERLTAKYKNGI